MLTTKEIIQQYYGHFNDGNMPKFLGLLHEDVIHDINQGGVEIGKQAFAEFMDEMNRCYSEEISNLVIFTPEHNTHAAAKFTVTGTYLKAQPGLPEAHHQHYQLECGAFFEIVDGKIKRITNYYNLNDWLKQIRK